MLASPQKDGEIVDLMLEKQPNNCQIHRLQILALMESDLNQAIRMLLAHQLTPHMEAIGIAPSMQHGSRDGCQCMTAILNKQLMHDIVRQTKTIAAFIENDEIGCYDRMVSSLLLLELKRLGVSDNIILALALIWDGAQHHIKTKYGISDTSYANSLQTPLFGPGQGSTLGPFLWLILFSLIVLSISPGSPKATFTSTTGQHTVSDIGEAFIDDSFLAVTNPISMPLNLSSKAQKEQSE
jgi:hypothetical protein